MATYVPSTLFTPEKSNYVAVKEGGSRLKAAALITDQMIPSLSFEVSTAREVYKSIRTKNGTAGDGKNPYMFLASLHVRYEDSFVTDKWYVKGVIIDLKKNLDKNGAKYGVSFLSVGIPEPLFEAVRAHATDLMGIQYDTNTITRNGGYVWQNNNIDAFKSSCHIVKGASAFRTSYDVIKAHFSDNPLVYGVLEFRIKCALDVDDLGVALKSRKWYIGWALQSAYVYSHTSTGAPALTGTAPKVNVALPKEDYSDKYMEQMIMKCGMGADSNSAPTQTPVA